MLLALLEPVTALADGADTAKSSLTTTPAPAPRSSSVRLPAADPPLLGREWYEDGGWFTFSAPIPVGKQHIESGSGVSIDVTTYAFVFSGGLPLTSWLELGGQFYEGGSGAKVKDNPTYEHYSTFIIFGGPWLRPYVRTGPLRVWVGGGYLGGGVISTVTPRDPAQKALDSSRFSSGAVYGGGIDYGFATKKKNAFVLSASVEGGAPPINERFVKTEKDRNVGPALAPVRILVGMGGGF